MNKLIWLGSLVLGILGFCLNTSGLADPSGNLPPQPPFLQPPPDRASWVMTVVPGETNPAPGAAGVLVQQQVTQTGKIKHEINSWSDGQKSEVWIVNGMLLVENPQGHFLNLIDPSRDQAAADYLRYEFSRLSWLSPNTYGHTEMHEGVSCYWFKNGLQNNSTNELPAGGAGFSSPSAEAWINAETRQVVSVKVGSTLYNFNYGAAPDSDLVLSPKFAALWQGYLAAINPLNVQQPPSH
ncbi:MAG TPA: hypothetical protein VGC39_00535 [Candidatus Methylacidiphilales bacterium]